MKFLALVGIVTLTFFVGCEKETSSQKNSKSGQVKLFDDSVVVRVDSCQLTKAQADSYAALRYSLLAKKTSKLNDGQKKRTLCRLANNYVREFADRALIIQQAEKSELKIPDAEWTKYREEMVKNIGWKGDFDSYRLSLPKGQQEILDYEMRGDLLENEWKRILFLKTPSPSEKEISKVISNITLYNKNAAATNRIFYAEASNVWQQVASGKISFDDAQRDFTKEDLDADDLSWGAFRAGDLDEYPNLKPFVLKMSPGDITPPVEADNGILIVRLDNNEDGNFELSRIAFNKAIVYDMPSRDTVRQQLIEKWKKTKYRKMLQQLRKKAKIEYPYGKVIYKDAEKRTFADLVSRPH